jgi:hypothetical protein
LSVGEEFEFNSDIGVTWVASWDDDWDGVGIEGVIFSE